MCESGLGEGKLPGDNDQMIDQQLRALAHGGEHLPRL